MINIETRVTETFTVRPTVGGDDDGEVEAEERERQSSEESDEAGPVSPDIYSQRFELDILSSSPPGRRCGPGNCEMYWPGPACSRSVNIL